MEPRLPFSNPLCVLCFQRQSLGPLLIKRVSDFRFFCVFVSKGNCLDCYLYYMKCSMIIILKSPIPVPAANTASSYHAQFVHIQSTLVISTSLISNNRLSRSENQVPILTWKSTNRQQNIVDKRRNCSLGAIYPLFHNIFNISLRNQITYSFC